MDPLIEAIRTAVAPDATPEARAAGVVACRSILGALDAKAGEPLVAGPPAEAGPVASAIASLIRTTPPDKLFDLMIDKLRALAPANTPPVAPVFRLPRLGIPKR